jgi:hypothetical protein
VTERSIFLGALDIPEPSDRAAFLDRACAGNPDLRGLVEQLLAAHAGAGSVLELRPAATAALLFDRSGQLLQAEHPVILQLTRERPPSADGAEKR